MKAIYAGSFDPITFGHLDIIRRASEAFELTVAIGTNPQKQYTLTLKERLGLVKSLCPTVRVVLFDGLLADFAYEQGIRTIIKGVRNHQDFDYERLLHDISLTQQTGIDTHILVARPEFAHISSGAAKELVKHAGLVHNYVPLKVKQALELANGQIIIGITGEIASGKSWLGKSLASVESNNIELDSLVHSMYESNLPLYIELRQQIIKEFKLSGGFSRKELGDIVFKDYAKLQYLNELIKNPLLTLLRKTIRDKKGAIFLNSALLAESDLLPLCNNNVIVTRVDRHVQIERLKGRGLEDRQIDQRIYAQYNTGLKIGKIRDSIDKHSHGRYIVHETEEETRTFLSNL